MLSHLKLCVCVCACVCACRSLWLLSRCFVGGAWNQKAKVKGGGRRMEGGGEGE